MARYRLLRGEHRAVEDGRRVLKTAGDVLELSDSAAAAFNDKVELVDEPAAPPADTPPQPAGDFPEGEPSLDWLKPEIEAYAQHHGVDLPAGGTKAAYLEAIALATAG